MLRKILYLLVLREVLVCLALLYEVLALLLGLQAFPYGPFFMLMGTIFLFNLLCFFVLFWVKGQNALNTHAKSQIIFDAFFISILVGVTGAFESDFVVGYLVIILVSGIFLTRTGILIFTLFCFSLYYFTSQFVLYGLNFVTDFTVYENYNYTIAGQFIAFFTVGFISGYFHHAFTLHQSKIREQANRLKVMRAFRDRIVENLQSGLLTTDLKGEITHINSRVAILLNRPEPEIIGHLIWNFFAVSPDLVQSGVQAGNAFRFDCSLHGCDRLKIFGVSCTSLELEANRPGYLMIFQDLTEIKMRERSQYLEDRMAAIGKVAAGVAHELRNPLASITGSIQVLREMVPEGPATGELMDIIEKEGGRLDRIVSEFLAYSRATPTVGNVPFDLRACFEDFATLAQHDKEIKNVWLQNQYDADAYWIQGDPSRITQVFWNLVRNAAQASKPGQRIETEFTTHGHSVRVSIQDFGCGIPSELLTEVFSPFATYNKPQGTGLGLSIVYDTIQMHHAKIDLQSEPGKGTRVLLEFPLIEMGSS
ncbi:MAG: PAS domain-containing protein [Acidobacteria bacterium]|nr:PAS domain-containing protein [Acidobacteriota bacterium]MCB9396910.1 PAS domain-containing protein [Acidobacteriota bacterium]